MPITLFNLLQATCKWNFLHDPCCSFNYCRVLWICRFLSRASFGSFEYPNSRNKIVIQVLAFLRRRWIQKTSFGPHIPPHPSTLGPHLRHVWIQENWVVADHHRVLPQSKKKLRYDSIQNNSIFPLENWKSLKSVSCAERQPQLLNCSLEIHLADERKRASYVGEQVHLDVRHTAISCATSMVSMQNLLSLLEEDFGEQQTAWKFTKSTSRLSTLTFFIIASSPLLRSRFQCVLHRFLRFKLPPRVIFPRSPKRRNRPVDRPCLDRRLSMGRMDESSLKRWESENCTRASGDTMNLSKLRCRKKPKEIIHLKGNQWQFLRQRMPNYVNCERHQGFVSQGTVGMLWSFAWANCGMQNNSSHFNP